LTPFDLKRLGAYANNQLDYHVVLDLMPTAALLYFENRLGESVKPTAVQSAILLALGLQRKTIEDVESELQLPVSQALALFAKLVRKISTALNEIQKVAVTSELPPPPSHVRMGALNSALQSTLPELTEELEQAGEEAASALRAKQKAFVESLDISQYSVDDPTMDWAAAEKHVAEGRGAKGKSMIVSIKGSGGKRKATDGETATPAKKKKSSKHKH